MAFDVVISIEYDELIPLGLDEAIRLADEFQYEDILALLQKDKEETS